MSHVIDASQRNDIGHGLNKNPWYMKDVYEILFFITITSHEGLKSPEIWLFVTNNKENQVRITGHFWREIHR